MGKGMEAVVLVVVLAVASSSSAIVHELLEEVPRGALLLTGSPTTSTTTTTTETEGRPELSPRRPGPTEGPGFAPPRRTEDPLTAFTPPRRAEEPLTAFTPPRRAEEPLTAFDPPRPRPTTTTTTGREEPARDFSRPTGPGDRVHRPTHIEPQTRDQCLPVDPNGRADSQGINGFGLDVFRYLAKEGNVFFSPFNLWSALALAYMGAEKETSTQMGRLLGLQGKQNTLQYLNGLENQLSSRFDGHKNLSLEAASKVYIQQDFEINACLQSYLTDRLQSIDFSQITEAANTINSYVNKTTHGLIDSIIQPGQLTDTKMAIISAIYFFGTWEKAFSPSFTHDAPFHRRPNERRPQQVKMMSMEASLQLGKSEELGAQVLRLPYTTGNIAMYILLPTTEGRKGFEDTLRALNPRALHNAVGGLSETLVQVIMPKFKMETKYDQNLKEALKGLGATDMFDSGLADFSSFSPVVYVSTVVHKAFVDVTEAGTEAAAATAVLLDLRSASARADPKPFICDRPFIFAIYDDVADVMLFLGAYTTPPKA